MCKVLIYSTLFIYGSLWTENVKVLIYSTLFVAIRTTAAKQ